MYLSTKGPAISQPPFSHQTRRTYARRGMARHGFPGTPIRCTTTSMANPDPRLNEIEFEFLANFVAEQNSDGSRGFSQNNDWNLELVTLESFDHIRIELKCP